MKRIGQLYRRACLVLAVVLAVIAHNVPASPATIGGVHGPGSGPETNSVGLDDWLTVDIQGLTLAQQTFATQNESKLVLYLGVIPIRGLCTDGCVNTNTGDGSFRFQLERTDANRADWMALLGSPSLVKPTLTLHVSVGLGDDYRLPAQNDQADKIHFIVLRTGWVWTCGLFTVVLLLALFKLATATNALRDDSPPVPAGQLRTYSLARCQMAFWFALTLPTFVYLWLITGALDTLTSSVLVLMGVSAGTAVFAHAIGSPGADSSGATKISAGDLPTPPPTGHVDRFIKDALKDDDGSISFHHFQMFVWTLVLGIIFLVQVWHNLAMPEFSDTLLGLMGISSGTYLGFMLKDK